MQRRRLLRWGALGACGAFAGGSTAAWWLNGPAPPIERFANVDQALAWIDQLGMASQPVTTGPWSLPEILQHLTQGIDYSLQGYPEAKPRWVQQSGGRLAYHAFARLGRMHHALDEPLPGAPALHWDRVAVAAQSLRHALLRFEAHEGPLAAHFAFGNLDKAQYRSAHLMHLADHARAVQLA